jgi:hypothetical protein
MGANRSQKKQTHTMKYLKTINLWAADIQDAVMRGQIRLQPGQWVSCGGGAPSRFVKTTGRSLWVAHPQGTAQATRERFLALVQASK